MTDVYSEIVTVGLPGQLGVIGQWTKAFIKESTADFLTAHAGGGQQNGWPITARWSRFTTVTTAGDSATLPPSQAGMSVVIRNDGANAMNVFPASGEYINAGTVNAAYSLIAAKEIVLRCYTAGTWIGAVN